ncbi:hypothetical protein ACFL6Y_11625 [Elusimicrobiota bacterium]
MIPNYNVSFLGGQYFFTGTEANLSGNLHVLASPALKYSDKFMLLPIYSMKYQGVKQVTDLVGGGTLFQEKNNHKMGLKGVYTKSEKWAYKTSLGYTWEFLKETRDERWGEGLFDYQRPAIGIEAEYTYKDPFSVRFMYDFYQVNFINYESLESQVAAGVDSGLGREYAGKDTLDSNNHALSVVGSRPVKIRETPIVLEGGINVTMRHHPDQMRVKSNGLYATDKRDDMVYTLSAGSLFPLKRGGKTKVTGTFGLGYSINDSNQHNYDAGKLEYTQNYYDYNKLRVSPGASFMFGEDEAMARRLSFNYTYELQDYKKRRVQDSEGLYKTNTINTKTHVATGSFMYPLEEKMKVNFTISYGKSKSNMKYESVYKYNFDTLNYLFGITYTY